MQTIHGTHTLLTYDVCVPCVVGGERGHGREVSYGEKTVYRSSAETNETMR